MPDKELTCLNCGNGFVFTEAEQERNARRGYRYPPKICPDCRRYLRDGRTERAAPKLHEITCSRCGKQARVPFKPREDRPVFCDDCFREQKA